MLHGMGSKGVASLIVTKFKICEWIPVSLMENIFLQIQHFQQRKIPLVLLNTQKVLSKIIENW